MSDFFLFAQDPTFCHTAWATRTRGGYLVIQFRSEGRKQQFHANWVSRDRAWIALTPKGELHVAIEEGGGQLRHLAIPALSNSYFWHVADPHPQFPDLEKLRSISGASKLELLRLPRGGCWIHPSARRVGFQTFGGVEDKTGPLPEGPIFDLDTSFWHPLKGGVVAWQQVAGGAIYCKRVFPASRPSLAAPVARALMPPVGVVHTLVSVHPAGLGVLIKSNVLNCYTFWTVGGKRLAFESLCPPQWSRFGSVLFSPKEREAWRMNPDGTQTFLGRALSPLAAVWEDSQGGVHFVNFEGDETF